MSRVSFGLLVTAAWIVFWSVFITLAYGSDVFDLKLNEIGDFFAGIFSPVAFFWFILAYLQQASELEQQREEFKRQADAHDKVEQHSSKALFFNILTFGERNLRGMLEEIIDKIEDYQEAANIKSRADNAGDHNVVFRYFQRKYSKRTGDQIWTELRGAGVSLNFLESWLSYYEQLESQLKDADPGGKVFKMFEHGDLIRVSKTLNRAKKAAHKEKEKTQSNQQDT
mgnify:CR=1 FL=1